LAECGLGCNLLSTKLIRFRIINFATLVLGRSITHFKFRLTTDRHIITWFLFSPILRFLLSPGSTSVFLILARLITVALTRLHFFNYLINLISINKVFPLKIDLLAGTYDSPKLLNF
jgi:hypothetical protein